jgi:hypothetical protein
MLCERGMARLAILLAVLCLGYVAAASASGDTVRTYAGITCAWPSSTSEGSVICRRSNGTGFAVAVAERFVAVRVWRNGRVLFFRNQPTHSVGFGSLNDPRIFHRETHRGIICYWSRVARGTAICNRSDNHGYVVAVSGFQVAVSNEKSRVVYLRNQP